jgi:plastocyanin
MFSWFKLSRSLIILISSWILYTLFHTAYETLPYSLKTITIEDLEFLGLLVVISEIGIVIGSIAVLFNILKRYNISYKKIAAILIILLFIPMLSYYNDVNAYKFKNKSVIIIDTAIPYVCGSETFEPTYIRVIIGINNTVTWKNISPFTQSVVAFDGSFSSGPIPPGGEWSYTFTKNGTYKYRSGFYSWVQGSIIVVGG